VTGAARAAVPVVTAVARTQPVTYAEVVASMAARSADPQTRAGIDTYLDDTCAAITSTGAARTAKTVVVLNPADPPVPTRYTVYCLVPGDCDAPALERAIVAAVDAAAVHLAGYRLARPVQFETVGPLDLPETGSFTGTRITSLLEIRAS
jgi:acetaldehyde dehydrogenase